MLVSKIISIKGLSRFDALNASGDVGFRRLTLIYGDNGTGKTSLAAVFRSLATGDRFYLDERATLGAATGPEVSILIAGGTAKFKDGAWTATVPDLEVFDTNFVNENVYTGDRVELEHRKNLYEVVVGQTAVGLARRIDEINSESKSAARRLTDLDKELSSRYQGPYALEAFLNLQPEPDLDQKVEAVTGQLNASRKAKEIVARPQPAPVNIPTPPDGVFEVLRSTTETVSEEAEQRVKRHIADHLDPRGEAWLRQGLGYSDSRDSCPFCQQKLNDASAISLYREYFSQAYREHTVQIQRAMDSVERTLSDEARTRIHEVLLKNQSIADSWKDLADLNHLRFELHDLDTAWDSARERLRGAFHEKLRNPSDAPEETDRAEAALAGLIEELQKLSAHNEQIQKANDQIADLKKASASADTVALESELRRLRNMQIRQQDETAALCDEYIAAQSKKAELESEKKVTRQSLEAAATDLLTEHEKEINRLLACFGARFRITETKPSFSGGAASSTYKIAINDQPLSLGSGKTPKGQPSFRTALSAGDKSTLALAFFLAKLRRDTNLANKAVMFDDPLSSLDLFRLTFTQQEISRIAGEANQAVVLSHDPYFLKGLLDGMESADVRTLTLARQGSGFTLQPWDVDEYCLLQSHKDYFVLKRFAADGVSPGSEPLIVARSIRPYLEGNLRHRFPAEFSGIHMLGKMIAKIREAQAAPLNLLQLQLSELEDINDYSKRFHHGGPGAPPTPNEAELFAYVERAFKFVQQ